MKKEIRWVIIGKYGLYVGQWFTRKDAIYDHIRALHGLHLTKEEEIKEAWGIRKEMGDKAIKATITYEG